MTGCYYNVRQVLQSAIDCYYKVRQVLQSGTEVYYKVCQLLKNATSFTNSYRLLLQSASGITKWDSCYKVRCKTYLFLNSPPLFECWRPLVSNFTSSILVHKFFRYFEYSLWSRYFSGHLNFQHLSIRAKLIIFLCTSHETKMICYFVNWEPHFFWKGSIL